jgi:hypothetical protein
MASLIPGFEYDVFISYRQKDNKHDGWVTGFVETPDNCSRKEYVLKPEHLQNLAELSLRKTFYNCTLNGCILTS